MLTAAALETSAPGASTEDLSASEMFGQLFSHLNAHTYFSFDVAGVTVNVTNHTFAMLFAGVILLLVFWGGHAARGLRDGRVPRGRFAHLIESLVGFVCEEMIYPIMGREVGRRYAPLFLTQFFFIWTVNLLSNLPLGPLPVGGAPTASIAVTAALASTTLFVMVVAGVKASGVIGHWKGLVPHGLPPGIREMLFVVELAGFFIRPIALAIRLFANMFGGHLVVLSLFGLVYVFKSWLIYGLVLPMSLFVGVLELLVAFLQAFIFTFLSIMFVQASVHPEH